MTTTGTCESCGVDDDHLSPVRRRYLASDDRPERILDDVELWCVACRTSYPHDAAD